MFSGEAAPSPSAPPLADSQLRGHRADMPWLHCWRMPAEGLRKISLLRDGCRESLSSRQVLPVRGCDVRDCGGLGAWRLRLKAVTGGGVEDAWLPPAIAEPPHLSRLLVTRGNKFPYNLSPVPLRDTIAVKHITQRQRSQSGYIWHAAIPREIKESQSSRPLLICPQVSVALTARG